VTGPLGAGHTRFLHEVATIAALRGFPAVRETGGPPGAIVLVDVGEDLPDAPQAAGVVYATTNGRPTDDRYPPVFAVVELRPWSTATLTIWLRTVLQGEPSRALVNWLAAQTGGLPARAVKELDRLRERGGLRAAGDGTWTVAPELSGRSRRRARLPVPMTKLVGRDAERARVAELLGEGRLVTLVGPGGIGKTRLSLAVAGDVGERFADGAVFVPLADTTGTDLVVAALAQALGVPEAPDQRLLDSVVDHVADRELLLVFDNFEQVVDAATVVSALLSAAPGVSALVTSRERLSLYGEQVYQVPALADSPALTLFEQRARAVDADFTVSADTALAIATLCRRLDGLPLAIELAAARTDRLTPDELLEQLAHHLDALGDGPRDLPARQQTLRGAIDWSYALLDQDDQRLFVALSVFAGGAALDAALAVVDTGGEEDADVRRKRLAVRLATLADKSLLVAEEQDGGRYRMLETIRAYAAARLAEDDGSAGVYAAHARFFADFAEASATGMAGPEQAAWAAKVEREYQNVRAAFSWSAANHDTDAASRVCLGLWRYWRNGNHLGEGRDWLDRLIASDAEAPDRARLLHAAAVLAATQDDHERAYLLAAESLRRAADAGDRATEAHAHNVLGIASIGSGDYRGATDHFGQSLAIWRELAVPQGTAAALGNLTKVSLRLGDVEAADRYASECLALERAAGNTRGIQLGLECLGQIRLAQGDVPAARAALTESLALSRTLGDAFGTAMALHQLGLAALASGDHGDAVRLVKEALAKRHEVGDRIDLAISLDVLASLLAEARPALAARPAFAARLVGAADGLRTRHRLPVPPDSETRRNVTLPQVSGYSAARAAGRSAPLDEIVEEAIDVGD
jgi:predicted ATPase